MAVAELQAPPGRCSNVTLISNNKMKVQNVSTRLVKRVVALRVMKLLAILTFDSDGPLHVSSVMPVCPSSSSALRSSFNALWSCRSHSAAPPPSLSSSQSQKATRTNREEVVEEDGNDEERHIREEDGTGDIASGVVETLLASIIARCKLGL
jgi:hypothetical protein